MLLIIDNGSCYLNSLKETLDTWKIKFKVYNNDQRYPLRNAKGIILSGGPGNPATRTDLKNNYLALEQAKAPILGICLGHEIIAYHYGARIERLPKQQTGLQEIVLSQNYELFKGLGKRFFLEKMHHYHVATLPTNFKALGSSKNCPFEIIKHRTKPIYGLQGHPEVSKDGTIIIKNFLKLCGIRNKFIN